MRPGKKTVQDMPGTRCHRGRGVCAKCDRLPNPKRLERRQEYTWEDLVDELDHLIPVYGAARTSEMLRVSAAAISRAAYRNKHIEYGRIFNRLYKASRA